METTVKAYFDGTAFVPVTPVTTIQKGKVFLLSINQDDTIDLDDKTQKMKAFQEITDNLCKLNVTEPLSPEFDKILSNRLHFKNKINL